MSNTDYYVHYINLFLVHTTVVVLNVDYHTVRWKTENPSIDEIAMLHGVFVPVRFKRRDGVACS